MDCLYLEKEGKANRSITITKALYWDTGDHNSKNSVPPYHYVRIQSIDNGSSKEKEKEKVIC